MITVSKISAATVKMVTAFCCSLLSSFFVVAQDELSDLPLDELANIGIKKKSSGLLERKKYNPDNIYLGLLLPYSKQREYSRELKNAVELAINEINTAGGVLEKKLDLIAADDGAHKELAVLYTDSLVRSYKISAIIGPSASARVIHLAKAYLPKHSVLVISPSASSDDISLLNDNNLVWRTMPSDAQQSKIAAHYIYDSLKKRSVGILYTQDVYGRGLCEGFKKNFKGTVKSEVSFSPLLDLKTFDLSQKLDELLKERPHAVFLAIGAEDAAIVSHKISKGKYLSDNYKPIFFGVDAMKDKNLIKRGNKKLIEGMYGTDLASSKSSAFKGRYFRKFRKNPTFTDAERVYDIVYILALAMQQGRSVNSVNISAELRKVTETGEKVGPDNFAEALKKIKSSKDIYFEGVSGGIKFDDNGDLASGSYEIWQIKNRQFTTVKLLPFGDDH